MKTERRRGRIFRFFFPQSLRFQLLSRSLLILSALLVFIGIFQYIIMSQFLYQNTANNIGATIRNLGPDEWDQLTGEDDDPGHHGNPFFSLGHTSISVASIGSNGKPKTIQGNPPNLGLQAYQSIQAKQSQRPFGEPQPAQTTYQIVRNSAGESQLVVVEPVADPDGDDQTAQTLIQVGTSVEDLDEVLMRQLVIFLSLAVCALILGLVTFLPILRKTLVPLSNMINTVRKINAGNLSERVRTEKNQLEIEELASSFNQMLERLGKSFESEREAKERMRRFIADASHELRTPLTSIHGFLEVLLRGAASNPQQLDRALRSMYSESGRITKLVQDLLQLAQLDREPTMLLQIGRLDEIIHEMEPQLRLLAGKRSVRFNLVKHVQAKVNKDGMKQVVLNLFHNAVQHTDAESGVIEVTLTVEEQQALLKIKDNGPGIAPEHIEQLFERFYRADTARSRNQGGAGLGLAITKSIVDRHGGTITCDSGLSLGTTFTVSLPLV